MHVSGVCVCVCVWTRKDLCFLFRAGWWVRIGVPDLKFCRPIKRIPKSDGPVSTIGSQYGNTAL